MTIAEKWIELGFKAGIVHRCIGGLPPSESWIEGVRDRSRPYWDAFVRGCHHENNLRNSGNGTSPHEVKKMRLKHHRRMYLPPVNMNAKD